MCSLSCVQCWDSFLKVTVGISQQLDEDIARLKDNLQELKAEKALEGKYVKKESEVT